MAIADDAKNDPPLTSARLGIDLRGSVVSWAAPTDWPIDPLTDEPAIADFSYRAAGGGKEVFVVTLHRAPQCLPQSSNLVVRSSNRRLTMLRLGDVCGGGEWAATEILAPPTRGQLFEFLPKRQLWPYSRPLEVITRFQSLLRASRGRYFRQGDA